ncbi:uncharacterized protein LOC113576884 isoform X2 [Electrophorus electricus]|uniref:uncharacterized protein LOC113576884 isoform X2 n=1 Tax=Electrophorus electricus TaxID=8005 RepID=UPI0015D05DE6|nr:uncharacterized protein LOC113576884 isoform X2 [Electrophorus electricus]
MFLGLYFSASWLFITTWVAVPYSSNTGVATFQMVLVGGEDDELSFLLMNYGDIAPTGQPWLAGYRSESGIYKYTIDEPNPSDLSKSTNKGLPGQWAFRVDEEMEHCTALRMKCAWRKLEFMAVTVQRKIRGPTRKFSVSKPRGWHHADTGEWRLHIWSLLLQDVHLHKDVYQHLSALQHASVPCGKWELCSAMQWRL